ncbi:MAG: hypothetical protein AAF845_08405 [Bacteroidota bacterium]
MTRRYSEEDAQRIFALVAERQRAAQGAEGGLTLSELEEAARAAGLDPRLVAGAAAEVDALPDAQDRTFAGAPVEVVRQRLVPGAVDDDTWAQMVAAARAEFGDAGMAGQIGRLREWTLISGGTKNGTITRLALEPTADGTRITLSRTIREQVKALSIATVIQSGMAALFGVLAAVGVDPELWIPFGLLLILGLGFAVGTQIGTRIWHRHHSARFEAFLDRLELVSRAATPAAPRVEESTSVEPASVEPVSEVPAGRIDPGLLDLDVPSAEAAAPRRRTRS